MKDNIIDIINDHLESAPVDIYGMAKCLGIDVEHISMEDVCSGSLIKKDDGYVIEVNADHSENRKRFTVAHEIAHFLLHDNLIGNGIYDNAVYRSDDGRKNPNIKQYHETQANRLAAKLLMPKKLVNELQAQGIDSIFALANRLRVSEHAVGIRLQSVS